MKYKTIKELDEERFRRLTEVKRSTFNKMVEILQKENRPLSKFTSSTPDCKFQLSN